MRTVLKSMLVVMMVLALAAPAAAQDKKKKKKGRQKGRRGPVASLVTRLNKLEGVTAEQKAKIKEIAAKHGPKVMELQKKSAALLTADQKKAMNAARKKAQGEGKKGQELQKAVRGSVELSDEQKKKRTAIFREQRMAMVAIQKAISEVLTPEQRKAAKLNLRAGGKKGRKKGKKKKKADNS